MDHRQRYPVKYVAANEARDDELPKEVVLVSVPGTASSSITSEATSMTKYYSDYGAVFQLDL